MKHLIISLVFIPVSAFSQTAAPDGRYSYCGTLDQFRGQKVITLIKDTTCCKAIDWTFRQGGELVFTSRDECDKINKVQFNLPSGAWLVREKLLSVSKNDQFWNDYRIVSTSGNKLVLEKVE